MKKWTITPAPFRGGRRLPLPGAEGDSLTHRLRLHVRRSHPLRGFRSHYRFQAAPAAALSPGGRFSTVDIDYPNWEYDAHFDIRRHIVRLTVDAPGDEEALE